MNENPYESASPAAPAYAPEPLTRVLLPFEFRGNGGEYFRIWIVNLLLTIVTLGIFSAWAKVRRLRYFYGNTFVDGHSFDYHGQPLAILKGRLIVFAGYVMFFIASLKYQVAAGIIALVLVVVGVPWIITRSRKFQLRMTSYRNLRFNFHGTYGGAMASFIGWYFLAVISFGILLPVWVRKRVQYSMDNGAYGSQPFSFLTGNGTYYKFCLLSFFGGFAIYLGVIFLFFRLPEVRELLRTGGIGTTGAEMLLAAGPTGWALIAGGIVAMLGIVGYYQSSFANAAFGGIQAGSQYLRSNLRPWALIGIYVSNLFAMVFTLGLYYPWAKVRQLRYQLENTAIDSDGNLAAFTASSGEGIDAVGEEIGDFFDVDFGI